MTGAALPQHVDAVIPQEDVRLKKGALVIRRAVRAGDHVRRSGEDCGRGDVAIPKGTRLHPGAMALLSMLGVRQVAVRRAPRVGIVITGSEVRPAASRSLPAYAVRDSHAPFLTAALDEFGLTPSPVLYTRDDARPIREGIVRALARADLVIVTGGVSVGDRDLVRPVLSELGARTIVEGVAQRPGKPLYFGVLRGTAVFGLPGNPGSLVVCYCEYVRPVIRAMLGEAPRLSEEWTARLAEPVARRDSRTQFLRGRLAREDGAWRVALDRRQGSNLLGSFLASDCLVVVPPGPGRPVRVGSVVRVRPLPWRRG